MNLVTLHHRRPSSVVYLLTLMTCRTHSGCCYAPQQLWRLQTLKLATTGSASYPRVWLQGITDIRNTREYNKCVSVCVCTGRTSWLSEAEVSRGWRRATGRHVARLAAGRCFREKLVHRNWLQDNFYGKGKRELKHLQHDVTILHSYSKHGLVKFWKCENLQ